MSVRSKAKARHKRLREHEDDDLPGTMGSYPTPKGTLIYPESKNPITWALRAPKISTETAESRRDRVREERRKRLELKRKE